MDFSATQWNKEYRAGRWEYLRGSSEKERYESVAQTIAKLVPQPKPRVLDVGCGEGTLLKWLNADIRYTGLDFSAVALDQAKAAFPSAEWIFASLANFPEITSRQFDIIVFNEVLYYLDAPGDTLRKYLPLLSPGGIVVISMFDLQPDIGGWSVRVKRTWDEIRAVRDCRPLSSRRIPGPDPQVSWQLETFQVN